MRTRPLTPPAERPHPEADRLRQLNDRIDDIFRARGRGAPDRAAWEQAVAASPAHPSWLAPFIHQASYERPYTDPVVIEFAVVFLELDPWFYGSGYLKETILRRLKSAPLSEAQQRRLRTVLLDAVAHREVREFRDYCRLAPHVSNTELVEEIRCFAREGAWRQRSRGRMMLRSLRAQW